LEGVANLGDFDLKQHAKFSGKDLSYFDEETNERLTPYVIEPSAGVDRSLLTFLLDAYREEQVRNEKRVVLKLHKDLAPVKVAGSAGAEPPGDRQPGPTWRPGSAGRAGHTTTRQHRRLYRRQDEIRRPIGQDHQTAPR
jgi:glycyl-tRNA synthetase